MNTIKIKNILSSVHGIFIFIPRLIYIYKYPFIKIKVEIIYD